MLDLIDIKSILIVEDDDALRDRLAIAMQKRGFEARTAASVAEGLAAIEQDVPGFAIIDLRLLDGSGLDVVRSLEKHAPEARIEFLRYRSIRSRRTRPA